MVTSINGNNLQTKIIKKDWFIVIFCEIYGINIVRILAECIVGNVYAV